MVAGRFLDRWQVLARKKSWIWNIFDGLGHQLTAAASYSSSPVASGGGRSCFSTTSLNSVNSCSQSTVLCGSQ
jgi:hypothetical protein